jgi:hypothetical protein
MQPGGETIQGLRYSGITGSAVGEHACICAGRYCNIGFLQSGLQQLQE